MEEVHRRFVSSSELRKHSSPSDLWISIEGQVYDVTHWVKDHPGGEIPLLHLAGQDVTDPFTAFHPPSARKLLSHFFVGCHLSDRRVSSVSLDYQLLSAELAELGLFEDKGGAAQLTLVTSLCLMLTLLSSAVYLVVATTSTWAHLTAGVLVGLLWIQSGWVGHDSGHGDSMPLNRIAQLASGNCIAGVSIGWWKRTHNAHHIACNSLDFDPDLQHIPVFAVSSKLFASLASRFYQRKMNFGSAARFLVSRQYLTFYPVMCVARFNLFAQSIHAILSSSINWKVPQRLEEMVGVMVFWVWYPYLVSFVPTCGERLMFVGACFAVTGIQHVLFCLSHFSSSVYVGQPQGNQWCEIQTAGSLNIDCSPWMDWFYGGIQFQVEHHLFPQLPRCHLRRIAPRVREFCGKHGLQYDSAGFWEANRRTLATLRAAAIQACELKNSVPKNLLWEALNTYG